MENHLHDPSPEVVDDLSSEDYHAHPALSSSGLKEIDRSPAHYFAAYLDPDREPNDDDTPAKKIGRAVHCAILEPAEFDNRYTAIPDGLDRRTKEGKALWNEIVASGREPLPAPQLETILATARGAQRVPVSRLLLSHPRGRCERSIFWTDPATGVRYKVRPDYLIEPCSDFPNGVIVDVKTAEDASPEGFGKSAWTYEMHLAAWLYPEGFMRAYGTAEPPEFLWLAVEKSRPFAAAYYHPTPAVTAYGRREVARLTGIYLECQRTGRWPAYGDTIQPISLPAWAAREIEQTEQAAA